MPIIDLTLIEFTIIDLTTMDRLNSFRIFGNFSASGSLDSSQADGNQANPASAASRASAYDAWFFTPNLKRG
ncbi:MAG: hypothetical protein WCA92_13895 [Terriglobales bacterium]